MKQRILAAAQRADARRDPRRYAHAGIGLAGEGGEQHALVVLNTRGGMLQGWTFLNTSDRRYLNRRRRGRLVFAEG